ncbi:DNA mismatch repair protein [Arachidicoccus ginsenosidimutans]|uniref:MutS-related protein n=1 Tax=Arachidicoccus sp. BS20 TaxID=1850526 RepID=UPI0007F17986|nr:DNA mismatch repair protein [Arachidicoccus sp. BS20]ANI88973.1 DNA mismatch repair protein [Arachidicoccus sp. BS20]
MVFNTDKQTLEELNLLGKFKSGSVYGLFNKVKTAGGERLLNDMFHHPLEDAAAINERSSIIRSFELARLSFPFDVRQLILMRDYLDMGTGKNKLLSFTDILTKKMLSWLARDERYKKMIQGLQSVIVTLDKCYRFLQTMQSTEIAAGVYEPKIKNIDSILSGGKLAALRKTDIYKALPVKTLVDYDHLLKNSLRQEMEEVLAFIYELDVYIAVGGVAADKGFSYARALPAQDNMLEAAGLYHPCINNAVGNAISLNRKNNVLFLTGANMAGKSTLMKSVGINLYLAQMGFPVAATQMKFSVREGLYSSINVADNINLGYSHFYAEVVRVKQAAEAAASGQRLLLMFDELFKGTNVKDAYDGTLAVTEAFAEYEECLFIVSTHIIEVGEALRDTPNIQFAYMPTEMEGNRPRYTYKMQQGITEDRQGMMIIKNEGILELLGS